MKYCVTINNKRYEVEVEKGEAAIVSRTESMPAAVESKNTAHKEAAAENVKTIESPKQSTEAEVVNFKEVVKAPMAGAITDIKVSVGTAVKIGDTLLMLEAMKMENEITAHVDGVIAEIMVQKGTNVFAADVLMVIK